MNHFQHHLPCHVEDLTVKEMYDVTLSRGGPASETGAMGEGKGVGIE